MQSRYTGHFPPFPIPLISNQHDAQAKEFYTAECTKVAGMEKYLRERGSEMTEDEMHQVSILIIYYYGSDHLLTIRLCCR